MCLALHSYKSSLVSNASHIVTRNDSVCNTNYLLLLLAAFVTQYEADSNCSLLFEGEIDTYNFTVYKTSVIETKEKHRIITTDEAFGKGELQIKGIFGSVFVIIIGSPDLKR